ncbi:MAG TPA: DNA-directed RNA polymerase subunit alpha C-terminal domain-containing protein, partial [Chloroflexota bacterium]|nr:DNA-directed RNA polymerase subunit alpha C-terminal domain-containing protein [Chloroflexota bacterium]
MDVLPGEVVLRHVLPVRTFRALKRAGLAGIPQLRRCSRAELLAIKGIGDAGVDAIEQVVRNRKPTPKLWELPLLDAWGLPGYLQYDLSLDELGLSARVRNALLAHGINSAARLSALSGRQLASIPGIGSRSLREIEDRVVELWERLPAGALGRSGWHRAQLIARMQSWTCSPSPAREGATRIVGARRGLTLLAGWYRRDERAGEGIRRVRRLLVRYEVWRWMDELGVDVDALPIPWVLPHSELWHVPGAPPRTLHDLFSYYGDGRLDRLEEYDPATERMAEAVSDYLSTLASRLLALMLYPADLDSEATRGIRAQAGRKSGKGVRLLDLLGLLFFDLRTRQVGVLAMRR